MHTVVCAYKFIHLDNLEALKQTLEQQGEKYQLLGTFLLSEEGINVNISSSIENLHGVVNDMKNDPRFSDMVFKFSHGETLPYTRFRVRIKPEIITFKAPDIDPACHTANHVSPKEFKQWLDEGRDVTILDARNDYEVAFGTFKNAIHCDISSFNHMPEIKEQLDSLDKEKPVVTFCTGGVRCEKSSVLLEQLGFKDVYQIDGGILAYFEQCGSAHYEGECFVFDRRFSLGADLNETDTIQCRMCRYPIFKEQQTIPAYATGNHCPQCMPI